MQLLNKQHQQILPKLQQLSQKLQTKQEINQIQSQPRPNGKNGTTLRWRVVVDKVQTTNSAKITTMPNNKKMTVLTTASTPTTKLCMFHNQPNLQNCINIRITREK